MTSEDNILYHTPDIHFAAYLIALDVHMVNSEAEMINGKKRVTFYFSISKAHINNFKNQYFGGSGTVKAKKYVNSLRDLRSLCYA